jgi:hypothetical protein
VAVEVMEMVGDSDHHRRGQRPGAKGLRMIQRTQEVVPFTRDLVKEFLEEADLKYLVDRDGDFVVFFDTPYPQRLLVQFILGGSKKEILQIAIRVDPSPPMEETEALKLVNSWNLRKRWPRAFYKGGKFYLDWSEDWETGVTPAILANTCLRVLAGANLFVDELNGQGQDL